MSLKFTTLIYHRVLKQPKFLYRFDPTIKEFDAQIKLLSSVFNCLTISEAVKLLNQKKLPFNALCITFDDGYRDFYTNAFPILQKYNVPATLYMTSNCLDGTPLWNEKLHYIILNKKITEIDCSFINLGIHKLDSHLARIRAISFLEKEIKYFSLSKRSNTIETLYSEYPCPIPKDTMLNKDQLIELSNLGIEIGSHTISHPILTCTPAHNISQEIFGSKQVLESIINKSVSSFAYPNGKFNIDYNQDHINAVKEAGYTSALSSDHKSTSGFDIYQIPRFSPARHQNIGLFLRLIKNHYF